MAGAGPSQGRGRSGCRSIAPSVPGRVRQALRRIVRASRLACGGAPARVAGDVLYSVLPSPAELRAPNLRHRPDRLGSVLGLQVRELGDTGREVVGCCRRPVPTRTGAPRDRPPAGRLRAVDVHRPRVPSQSTATPPIPAKRCRCFAGRAPPSRTGRWYGGHLALATAQNYQRQCVLGMRTNESDSPLGAVPREWLWHRCPQHYGLLLAAKFPAAARERVHRPVRSRRARFRHSVATDRRSKLCEWLSIA
jgi:hypothetical protein